MLADAQIAQAVQIKQYRVRRNDQVGGDAPHIANVQTILGHHCDLASKTVITVPRLHDQKKHRHRSKEGSNSEPEKDRLLRRIWLVMLFHGGVRPVEMQMCGLLSFH